MTNVRNDAGHHTAGDAMSVTVLHVGDERQPVIVIDRATGAGEALVDQAAHTGFQSAASIGSGYPGLLGAAPTRYLDAMVRFVLPLIATHFGTGPVVPARARGNFSLVTTSPVDLTPDQRVPHVDTADDLQFATVHYLCGEEHGGTGFFRHRATGYETIDTARLPHYRSVLDAELAATTAPARYPGDAGDPLFEPLHRCAARFDRLVLYRAGLLHSGLIEALPNRAADPRYGRLTGNLFLQCRVAA